jgi:hypothetical protein
VTLGKAANGVENPHLIAKIEARGRLVENQNPGFLSQRASDQGELALAAADPDPFAPGKRFDPEGREGLSRYLAIDG